MKPPIADPMEKQRDNGAREFYPSFWAVFVRYAVMTNFLIGIPLALVLQPGDWPTHRSGSGLNIVNWAFYLFPTLFALSETIKDVFLKAVTVGPEGLVVRNRWWQLSGLAWGDIRAVERRWGLPPELLVSGSEKRTSLSVSLLLRDMDGFAQAVEQYTEADHPLRVYLAKHGY